MKVALAKLRLGLHLLHGMWVIAVYFPRLSPARRTQRIRAWSLKLLRLAGMRLVVHHDERRLEQGALVVGNHISWIDIYVINAWRPTPFVSKAEVRKWPVVGWLAHRLGTVFVHREKRKDAHRTMHEMAARLQRGEVMCMFAEGTTSNGLDLLPFHANLFQAAVSAGSAVQPVCLLYEDASGRQTTAPAYIDEITLGESVSAVLRAAPLTAHLYIGEPIEAGTDRRALAARAREAVNDGLTQLQGQCLPALQPRQELAPVAAAPSAERTGSA
ncbi:lysophospholipid acyltransferase family protein [Trinickia caryophylli]|uniref:Lyso-ornithine lipid acyltransferase n=1 Tax=Trinickia caryophylli TaxID=28094 RepID=A0A1X7CHN9_TRICW|nr:lysophospholipid acyltransferase family protein [Trinickia caryophylli]PMS11557.1 1-acyl-sn-glycerol-3-phosphate acyltransferase [Trinickia caryophylli]TRX19890.1 1-acyl-sn-glycerol-3-phosphate acyltransferase [Trinickia caryophylli]WQE12775.1 lysophospholipid acyltransferase family protein [Trinickia caryophylli]SME96814.1 lyso-ornithine lipid acyltransferase [Trinickia caryophylli]GLU30490.1 1-acyl-sn-glycerol-3-phosphate acyltransferase [Trinickia caryophylli]